MYIKRDANQQIIAISQENADGFDEWLDNDSPEIMAFINPSLNKALQTNQLLRQNDEDFIRVLEDLINLLTHKGVIQFTELPEEVQTKLNERLRLRQGIHGLDGLSE